MEIEKEFNFIIIIYDILAKFRQSINLRKYIFIQIIKLTIKILTAVTSSKIPSNNSIWVEHRNYIENEIV